MIYQYKKCGAVVKKDELVCWFCNTYLDQNNIFIGKTKRRLKESSNKTKYQDFKTDNIDQINFMESGKKGFVYLLKGEKYFKIGKTKSLTRRTKTLNIQLPFKCQLVDAIMTNNIDSLEKFWHSRFASKRKNGEWFSLNKEELNEFLRKDRIMFE